MAEMELCYGNCIPTDTKGAQRLSVERLKPWQAMATIPGLRADH
jgi:hypothetical protein